MALYSKISKHYFIYFMQIRMLQCDLKYFYCVWTGAVAACQIASGNKEEAVFFSSHESITPEEAGGIIQCWKILLLLLLTLHWYGPLQHYKNRIEQYIWKTEKLISWLIFTQAGLVRSTKLPLKYWTLSHWMSLCGNYWHPSKHLKAFLLFLF